MPSFTSIRVFLGSKNLLPSAPFCDFGGLAVKYSSSKNRRCEAASPYLSNLGARCSKDGLDQGDPATMKKPLFHFFTWMFDVHLLFADDH
jgi:hypothetical protein